MTVTREPCGCKHDGQRWLAMCATDKAEFLERHLRAAKEKATAELIGRYTLPENTQPNQN